MENPENLTTFGTQDTRQIQTKQNKNTTQHIVYWTPLYANKHNYIMRILKK